MSKPSPTPKSLPLAERRSKKSHAAVLASAEALLAQSGYSSITIDQIALRAGVSKATIYRWWPNKAAIFMELYTVLGSKAQRAIDTGSLAGDLHLHVRRAFKLFRETVAGLALAGFVAEGQSNPDTARMLRDTFARQRRMINSAILERGIERGEIPVGTSVEAVSDIITGAVYYAVLMGQSAFTDARADQIVNTVLNGVLTTTRPASKAVARPARKRSNAGGRSRPQLLLQVPEEIQGST